MRITSKGQVTIPAHIREKAGLLPETEVEFAYDGKVVTLRPAPRGRSRKPDRGERLIAHLRSHRGDINMTTDEIMALTRGDED
jgi:AbrB family looped-hinge helix DNA binding protein